MKYRSLTDTEITDLAKQTARYTQALIAESVPLATLVPLLQQFSNALIIAILTGDDPDESWKS